MNTLLNQEAVDKLKQFIVLCKSKPDVLLFPKLQFFKEYIESLGGTIPIPKMSEATNKEAESDVKQEPATVDSDSESDLDIDNEGCLEPDVVDENQKMADVNKELSEEDIEKAQELRVKAIESFNEGNFEEAITIFSEAIETNPSSALLYAKRGQTFLKVSKPNACIRDCTHALELNCDSAAAYKFRGRAYRLLGQWENAAKDLRQACNIDFDEQTDEWLKEVTPNAQKIEQHKLKMERKKADKEEKAYLERLKKAKEAHAKASEENSPETETSEGAEGFTGMGDFYKLLQDPEIMTAFQDPDVAAAFQDISTNPANFIKYQSNPKVMALITKLSSKFSGSGMNFPGFPAGGIPGAGAFGGSAQKEPQGKQFEDDNLD